MISQIKKSFTFVEFMLAMSIIGFLVAILIPVLDRSKPDETTMLYRKTFFTIEEAVTYIINNPKLYNKRVGNDVDLLYPVAKENSAIKEDNNGYYLCRNIVDTLNTIGKVRCEAVNYSLINSENATLTDMTEDQINFRLPNGAVIGGFNTQNSWSKWDDDLTDVTTADYGYDMNQENKDLFQFITLCIDVNGPKKGLNEGCMTTHRASQFRDQFRIRIARNGRVYTGNSLGANNWYAENLMLVNPRSIVISKQKWTAGQSNNLTRSASANNKPNLDTGSTGLSYNDMTEFGYIRDPGIPRWSFTGGIKPSTTKLKAVIDAKNSSNSSNGGGS